MTRPIVIHLYDDATPGGVMRVLDHIRNDPMMARDAEHRFRPVRRGVWSFGRIEADIIVSHLAVNWRGLPWLIALRALHPGQALVHVEHSYTQAFVAGNVPNRARFETLLRTAYALFDRVVAVSQAQGAWLRDRRLVSDAALAVIRSAVDLGRFHALPPPRRTPKVLGAIGRLDRQKGFDILINALRSDPDLPLQLFVFGEGPERARLEALAAGDARIAFRGHVSDPVAAMAAVDAVAMPSRWEAFGLVASEARAAGRPVLAAPVDGLRDHIFDGARSVPSLSEADWQAGLRELGKVAGKQDTTSRTSAGTTTFQTEWRNLIVDMMHTQVGDCSTSPIKPQRAPVPSVAAVGVFGRTA